MQGDTGFEYVVYIGIFSIVFLVIMGLRERARKRAAYRFNPAPYVNRNNPASAAFADDAALKSAGLFGSKGWRIGLSDSGKILRYGGPGNLILVAPPRSGKAVTILVQALLDGGGD